MTIKARALVWGEYLNVEFQRDGLFDIVNREMDYELAFHAMGGNKTAAIELKEAIEEDALGWLLHHFDFRIAHSYECPPRPVVVLDFDASLVETFVVDVVAHILGIYEEYTRRTDIAHAIKESRRVIRGGRRLLDEEDALKTILDVFERRTSDPLVIRDYVVMGWGPAVSHAMKAARNMLVSVIRGEFKQGDFINSVIDVVHAATSVAANDASPRATLGYREGFDAAWQEERNWQLRRLLHLLEARQEGRPLPDIGETP